MALKKMFKIYNKKTSNLIKLFMRNKNVKVKKSLHWKPFLEYYCNHEYWNIEYKKFLKTLPYYKKVFSKFNFGHISDNESWNNWLFS